MNSTVKASGQHGHMYLSAHGERSNYYSTIIATCIISIIYIKIKFNSLTQVIA